MHLIRSDEAQALLNINDYKLKSWIKKGHLRNENPEKRPLRFNLARIDHIIIHCADGDKPTKLHALEWLNPQLKRKDKRQFLPL